MSARYRERYPGVRKPTVRIKAPTESLQVIGEYKAPLQNLDRPEQRRNRDHVIRADRTRTHQTTIGTPTFVADITVPLTAQGTLSVAVGQVAPQVGDWWNPNESASGYALDFKHGDLVVTTYSYKADGSAQWYLSSGPVVDNVFTASLDKYTNGQCISCS